MADTATADVPTVNLSSADLAAVRSGSANIPAADNAAILKVLGQSGTESPVLAPISGDDIGNLHLKLAALMADLGAQAKAKSGITSTQAKEVAGANETFFNMQQSAIAQQKTAEDTLAQNIATGTTEIVKRYGGNSSDATSDMAANNVALHDLNSRIMQQYNAITNLQNDSSIGGSLAQSIALPGMLRGMDVLNGMSQTIRNQNDSVLNSIALESKELTTTLTNQDVHGAMARSAVALATAGFQGTQNRLSSIGQDLHIFDTAQSMLGRDAALAAQARTDAVIKPLEIARNSLDMQLTQARLTELANDNAAMAKMASAVGWDPIGFKVISKELSKDDLLALAAFSNSGGYVSNPGDAVIIDKLANKRNLFNADGTPKNDFGTFLQEAGRLREQTSAYMSGYQKFIQDQMAAGKIDQRRGDALLAEKVPDAAVRAEYASKLKQLGVTIQSDLINANPKRNIAALPAGTAEREFPAVLEVANNMGNATTNMPVSALMTTVAKQNMDKNPAELALQTYQYAAKMLELDAARPIWRQLGIGVPNSSVVKAEMPPGYAIPGLNSYSDGSFDAGNYAAHVDFIRRVQNFEKATQRANSIDKGMAGSISAF
jgi:hypothetical protein